METFGSIMSGSRKALCFWVFCLLVCLGGWVEADAGPRAGDEDLSVGNSSTRAYFSRQGEWLGLFSSWTNGSSLFRRGGFIVVAEDESGVTQVIANTAEGNLLSVQSGANASITCCEGMKGGNRAPTLNPDDDADGRINEDRIDGIDNDGDGLVDEDFAAIGDEMIVSGYETRGQDERKLRFHQECYAWTHSHIEGMIAIRLLVENAGTSSLNDLRIGAFLQKKGPFSLSEELITNRPVQQMNPQQARGAVCTSPAGAALAILFPDLVPGDPRQGAGAWKIWSSSPGEPVAAVVDRILTGGMDLKEGYGISGDAGIPLSRDYLTTKTTQAKDRVFFGGLSPSLGKLAPGQTAEVTVFLVAMRNQEAVDRTLIDVHLTYLGDGTHRFIPPPVPVVPVVVWGSYERVEEPRDGLRVIIEENQSKNINFNRISFISGVDLNDLDVSATVTGETEITIFGQSAQRLMKKPGERIVLKGREESGAFFDAILNARRSVAAAPSLQVETADAYWKTPGKLSEELLAGSPNPFREQTSIFYEVPTVLETEDGRELKFWGTEETSIKVYDVTGRLVNILVDEPKAAGHYRVDWQATDENDIPVASGVYYIKLQIGKRYITKRILLLK